MIRRQEGFTLVELMVTMVIFVLTIAAAAKIFANLLTQFKQQSKQTETQMEGIVGLETLRRDIEQAGYGLPWNIPSTVTYPEATGAPASTFNDTPGDPSCPYCPRAIVSGNGATANPTIGASDYLVIKSTIVGVTATAPKWTYVVGRGDGTGNVKCWHPADPTCANPSPDDLNYPVGTDPRVIVLLPSRGESEVNQRILVTGGGAFFGQYSAVKTTFSPPDKNDKYLVYGVDQSTDLRMPFNRADYYIATSIPGSTIPPRCAPGTGLLVKRVVSHGGTTPAGNLQPPMPLMDCVADMEIIYGYDQNNDGTIAYTDDLSNLTIPSGQSMAQAIRDQVREVRVYILAHEGQKDENYVHANSAMTVGEFGLGRDFDLKAIADWQMYRWKVYTMAVHTKNLL